MTDQGWQCPKCERVWAPQISACGACNARQTLPPEIGAPHRPPHVEWNFTADDQSYINRPGVEL